MGAECAGVSFSRRREPAGLGKPATSMQLLTVTGMPWRGPSGLLHASFSVADLAARAEAASRWTKALSLGWRAEMRMSW